MVIRNGSSRGYSPGSSATRAQLGILVDQPGHAEAEGDQPAAPT